MDIDNLKAILEDIQAGRMDIDAALGRLKNLPFEDLGFARIDNHRSLRTGVSEVIYSEGKTVEQTMRETNHSAQAVHRYIRAFKQVLLCHRRGLSVGEIAYATKMTRPLVEEYLQLLQNLAKENSVVDQLLKSLETEAKT